MPSNVTDVPGSHGPRQSGSVIVPTEVPTHTSTISLGSHLCRFAGGGLVLFLSSLSNVDAASPLNKCELLVDATDDDTLAEDDDPAAEDDPPDAKAFNKLDGGAVDWSCDFSTLFAELLLLLPLELELLVLVLELLLLPLPPPLLLPLDEVECWRFDNCELAAAAEEICDDEWIMIGTTGLLLLLSFEDGGPGAFGVLLLLLNEEPVFEFEENKLFVVVVLELF